MSCEKISGFKENMKFRLVYEKAKFLMFKSKNNIIFTVNS